MGDTVDRSRFRVYIYIYILRKSGRCESYHLLVITAISSTLLVSRILVPRFLPRGGEGGGNNSFTVILPAILARRSSLLSIDFQIYDCTPRGGGGGGGSATSETYYSWDEDLLRNALKVDKSTRLSRVSYFSLSGTRRHRRPGGDFNARKDDSR